MISKKLLSIVIPTYNGENTIEQTLKSIINQIETSKMINKDKDYEIVLCDDLSEDRTFDIVEKYYKKYSYVKGFRNKENIGMDRNFLQTALHAQGKYIWFSGQDDLFTGNVVYIILSLLRKKNNVGIISINYSQYNHNMTKIICKSMLSKTAFSSEKVNQNKILIYKSASEYFASFKSLPTFLSATVMRREYMIKTDLSKYVGTCYIQVAAMLLNMNKHDIYVVTKPYIKGRIPDNGWQSNGQALFTAMTGNLIMQEVVYRDKRNPIPFKIHIKAKFLYLLNYYFLVYHCKLSGMQPSDNFKKNLQFIFGRRFIYYFYIYPILIFPLKLLGFFYIPLNAAKKIILTTGRFLAWIS